MNIKLISLSTIYTVLVMILVSLDGTYNITHSLFSKTSQEKYGTGMSFKNNGFILHIIIFTLLILAPNLFCKD
jgi:hypothetical protein